MTVEFQPVAKPERDVLQKQQASIDRRRALEAQRKPVIFDTKKRTIGVDMDALDKQVEEKEQRGKEERDRNRQYDEASLDIARRLSELQREKQRRIRERNIQIQTYRDLYQQRAETRDFDLNDPAKKRKEQPPRLGDDVKLPVSSLQMFTGEDLRKGGRIRQQQRELKQKADQTIQEKAATRKRMQEDEQAFDREMERINAELLRLQLERQANVRAHNVRIQNFNLDLDKVTNQTRDELAKHEQEMADKELEYYRQNDWFNERYETTLRTAPTTLYKSSRHHYIPYNFKGYSLEERQAILNEQAAQIAAKQSARQQEREQAKRAEEDMLEMNRRLTLLSRERQRNDAQHRLEVRFEQEQQKLEFKQKYDYINKDLYQNKIDDYYFNCFGTTTR